MIPRRLTESWIAPMLVLRGYGRCHQVDTRLCGLDWLRNVFNEEHATLIKQFTKSGGIFLNDVDRPVLERIASRTYATHGSFLVKKLENGGNEKSGYIATQAWKRSGIYIHSRLFCLQ